VAQLHEAVAQGAALVAVGGVVRAVRQLVGIAGEVVQLLFASRVVHVDEPLGADAAVQVLAEQPSAVPGAMQPGGDGGVTVESWKPPDGWSGWFVHTPVEWEYSPVKMLDRLGQHNGLDAKPFVNSMPLATSWDSTVGMAHSVSKR
jgi:hypothetical protein